MENNDKKKSSLIGCLLFIVLAFGSCAVALPDEEEQPITPVKSEPTTEETETNNEQQEAQRQAEEEAQHQAEEQRKAEEEAQRQQEQQQQTYESYKNCTALRAVHPDGVPAGHPAYDTKHDRDKDGWACEN